MSTPPERPAGSTPAHSPDPGPARPRRLRAGDRVALVAPAGPITEEQLRRARNRCEALGLVPQVGAWAMARDGYLAGTDTARAEDLRAALDDEAIAAVWAVRGGYGTMRILRRLDLGGVRARPTAFIGFSDNTALHLALLSAGSVSFHGPHAGYGPLSDWSLEALRRILFDVGAAGELPAEPDGARRQTLVPGVAEGELVGGNLSLLAALCGSPYQPDGAGRILFVEDVGEPVYRIDRMLTQLALAGVTRGLAGVAFGRFTEIRPRRADRPLATVLEEWARTVGVPAVAGLPFGHVADTWTLPLGVRARLDADARTVAILEPAVL